MSVDTKYRELLTYLLEPKTYNHSGDKTICYLTFSTDDILMVKRNLKQVWIDLAKNKGYGAKAHLDGIKEYGITIWHRKSFAPCKNKKSM